MAKEAKSLHTAHLHQQLVEQAADGIFTVDVRGIIFYANKAAFQMVMSSSKKVLGKHFFNFLENASRPKVKHYISEVIQRESIIRDEVHILTASGRIIPIEFSASPVFKDKRISFVHITIRNIERRKRKDQLTRETEKTRAMQNFLSGTAQEIQYPLKGLLKRTDGLLKFLEARDFEYIGYKEFCRIIETLQNMRDQIKYCADTTDRLMSIERKRMKLKGKQCEANRIIRDAVKSIKSHIDVSRGSLDTKLTARLPQVAIGSFELYQVLTKVLTNAVQAITSDGEILVRTTYLKKDNKVRILIKDNGIGISKDDLAHIFDPFFSTKYRSLEKSSGLGLSIVQSILTAHKGHIAIKSSIQKGTEVIILLPAV